MLLYFQQNLYIFFDYIFVTALIIIINLIIVKHYYYHIDNFLRKGTTYGRNTGSKMSTSPITRKMASPKINGMTTFGSLMETSIVEKSIYSLVEAHAKVSATWAKGAV